MKDEPTQVPTGLTILGRRGLTPAIRLVTASRRGSGEATQEESPSHHGRGWGRSHRARSNADHDEAD
jgi:hypothetical protein